MELAREVLGGRYEFVLTTHTDRDHVHNHLIFNAVSFSGSPALPLQQAELPRDPARQRPHLQGARPVGHRPRPGQGQELHRAPGGTGPGPATRLQLRSAIDRLLPGCAGLEDLLRRLQREGLRAEEGASTFPARAPGQERFTRIEGPGRGLRGGGPERPDRRGAPGRPASRSSMHREGPACSSTSRTTIKARQSAGLQAHWATHRAT